MSQAKHKKKSQVPPDEKLWRRISTKFGNNEELWDTIWDSENNNIHNFDFIYTLKPELYFKYDFLSDNHFIPNLLLFHNWRESNNTDLILEWNFIFNNREQL